MSPRPFCMPAGEGRAPSFAGRTLVLPVISVGSVPQLAVDLLINAPALQCAHAAYLDASCCVPFASPGEPGAQDICTPLDGTCAT